MSLRASQFFFFATLLFASLSSLSADLSLGKCYPIRFSDVDGNTLLTSDGHVTIVVLITPSNFSKAQMVGNRVPDSCLGNPTFRMVTIVKFAKHSRPVRAILTAGARHRLNAEAKRVQPRYDANKITRAPRRDIFAVADFDGSSVSQLGAESATDFYVYVFGRKGELLAKWNNVPRTEELSAVLK